MLNKAASGFAAGVLISIGGTVYLSCDNKYVGAFFFSIALICICLKGYSLYTGKIGFIPEKHRKEEVSVLLLGLLGNAVATVLFGYILSFALPAVGEAAKAVCAAKLTQPVLSTFIRAFFCGILMYLAVSIYRDNKTVIGILFCIPVFILSGFEHSIADIFYFAADGTAALKAFLFILNVILGNSLGAMMLPVITKIGKGADADVKS